MKGFCKKSEKFIEMYPEIPHSTVNLFVCPECGLIDNKEKTDDHVFNLPDWFVEYIEGRFVDSRKGVM